ncbi:MAG: serine hydrolase domain-containing protein, partial [Bacteroidota bacterium]
MNEFSHIPFQVSPWAVSPESQGFSSAKVQEIRHLLRQAISEKIIPGAVFLLQKKSQLICHESLGWRDLEQGQRQELDDIFGIASMSKAICSTALMILRDRAQCDLERPLSDYLPYFEEMAVIHTFDHKTGKYQTRPAEKPLLVKHLLNHTAGIPYPFLDGRVRFICQEKGGLDARKSLAQNVQKLAQIPLIHEPSQAWTYGYGTDIIGHLIEVISGKNLHDFIREELFIPLNMPDTGFYLDTTKQSRLSLTYLKTNHQLLAMKPYFADPKSHRFLSGGGGLYSTAEDYAHFLEMLLQKGMYNNKRIVNEESITQMTSNQIGALRI